MLLHVINENFVFFNFPWTFLYVPHFIVMRHHPPLPFHHSSHSALSLSNTRRIVFPTSSLNYLQIFNWSGILHILSVSISICICSVCEKWREWRLRRLFPPSPPTILFPLFSLTFEFWAFFLYNSWAQAHFIPILTSKTSKKRKRFEKESRAQPP